MQKYNWIIKAKPDADAVNKLKDDLGISETLAALLLQRGVQTFDQAKHFFRPNLKELLDPFIMKGMETAANRLKQAIEKSEKILIYGDYDVDGTTSVALMHSYVSRFSDQVDCYIPDRYSEGYGVSEKGISYAMDNDFQLMITLDCGIKAVEVFKMTENQDLDVIICDHHLPGKTLPPVLAILDPKQSDCPYPYKGLSGCGVGFKLIQAVHKLMDQDPDELWPLLDLLVTSIAADIVPITGENRILASKGLEVINTHPRPGLDAMLSPDIKGHATISDIVFGIAPKINAAGRISHAQAALKLLQAPTLDDAKTYLEPVLNQNEKRKDLDQSTLIEALEQVKLEPLDYVNVLFAPHWHKGILGIVASRVIEHYYKPTVVLSSSDENILVGSARSVKGFDVHAAIDSCSELLTKYGGHMYAAGLSLPKKNYEAFRQQFNDYVGSHIKPNQKIPSLEIDSLLDLNEINPKFVRVLMQMAPFGPVNMHPLFLSKGLLAVEPPQTMGRDKSHLRLKIKSPLADTVFEVTAFSRAIDKELFMQPFDMVYHIKINYWRGKQRLQLMMEDARTSE